jgi:hypothetical protein
MRVIPSSFSSRETVRETPDGVCPSCWAAVEKEPVSVTVTKVIRAPMSSICDSESKVYCTAACFSCTPDRQNAGFDQGNRRTQHATRTLGADTQRLRHRDDGIRDRRPDSHHRRQPAGVGALGRPAGQPVRARRRHRRAGADRPHRPRAAQAAAARPDAAVHGREPGRLDGARLRSADGRARADRPRARRVLLDRLDHRHQPGAEGKSRQRDRPDVQRPDRGPGHRRAARDLHRPALRLADDLPGRRHAGRGRLHRHRAAGAPHDRRQQAGRRC